MKNIIIKLLVVSMSAAYIFAMKAGAVPQAVESFDMAQEQLYDIESFEEENDGYLLAETSGTAGAKITWTFDVDGTLTISGTGTMYTWRRANLVPWYASRNLIKNVIIEDGVTTIGRYAFNDCKNIESISLPNTLTSVLNESFYGCKSLKKVLLPDAVTNIGNDAFYGCESLAEISIPDAVTKIGTNAFFGCSALASANIKGLTGAIPDGLFSGCSSLATVEISEGITSIGKSAFDGCAKLTGFEIPSGTTYIGEAAFRNCAKLKSAAIPVGVTEIYDYTFDGCTRLATLTFSEGLLHIGHRAFADCARVEELALPETLLSIGKMAFYGCEYLEDIVIPDSVKSVGEGAFRECYYAVSIYVGKNVEYIAPNAFYSCDDVEFITVNEENSYYVNDEYGVLFNKDKTVLLQYPCRRSDVSYKVPDGVERIDDGAFASTYYIRSVDIPEGVKAIGVSAFSECSNLAGVKVPDSVISIGSEFIDKTCTVYTNEDTYAHAYAVNNGYPYFIFFGDEILPSKVYLNAYYFSVKVDNTYTLTASVAPHFEGYTTIDDIVWTADDETVATVENGVISGIEKGSTYIYATCGDVYARANANVLRPVTGITLDREKVTLVLGETVLVTATVLPENASNKYVYWSTSDSSVATVSSGKITSKGIGTATITARTSDGSFKATVEVRVVDFIPGELTGDGAVDVNDAVLLLQHSMFPELYPLDRYSGSVDFTGDGAVDVNDAILLLQHSMFPELYPIS